jgi:hypothetical protein
MLDAYIIDRIRQERADRLRRESQIPLHIETPRVPLEPDHRQTDRDTPSERGSVVIDFQV